MPSPASLAPLHLQKPIEAKDLSPRRTHSSLHNPPVVLRSFWQAVGDRVSMSIIARGANGYRAGGAPRVDVGYHGSHA